MAYYSTEYSQVWLTIVLSTVKFGLLSTEYYTPQSSLAYYSTEYYTPQSSLAYYSTEYYTSQSSLAYYSTEYYTPQSSLAIDSTHNVMCTIYGLAYYSTSNGYIQNISSTCISVYVVTARVYNNNLHHCSHITCVHKNVCTYEHHSTVEVKTTKMKLFRVVVPESKLDPAERQCICLWRITLFSDFLCLWGAV